MPRTGCSPAGRSASVSKRRWFAISLCGQQAAQSEDRRPQRLSAVTCIHAAAAGQLWSKQWPEDKGPERYRGRCIHSVPFAALSGRYRPSTPEWRLCCVRRRDPTRRQALMTLNEPVFVRCAQALAMKTMNGRATDADRMTYAFRAASRSTTPRKRRSLDLLDRQKAKFADPDARPWNSRPPISQTAAVADGMQPFDAAA
jgi:hypothetical protein